MFKVLMRPIKKPKIYPVVEKLIVGLNVPGEPLKRRPHIDN